MAATVFNLSIEQGIPFTKKFLVRKADNSRPDMAGWTARMQFRPLISSQTVALNATTENGKLVIDTMDSSVSIVLTEEDTTNLDIVSYVYDIELVNAQSKPLRLTKGTVEIDREVTRNN